MAISVVMPALEMAQETGKLVSWLKQEGEPVRKGEILLEVETDKAVVEVEAAGDGILAGVTAKPGDEVHVGRTIAWLVQPGETPPAAASPDVTTGRRIDPSRVAPGSRADRPFTGGRRTHVAEGAAPRTGKRCRYQPSERFWSRRRDPGRRRRCGRQRRVRRRSARRIGFRCGGGPSAFA